MEPSCLEVGQLAKQMGGVANVYMSGPFNIEANNIK